MNDQPHVTKVADLAASYGLDLGGDLNNVTSSLLTPQQKSASLNPASAYGQLLQRFYNQQSIYTLFGANGSGNNSTIVSSNNSSFGSSSLKSRFSSNPQLYSTGNNLNNPNPFNNSKADRTGQEEKCNSPTHDKRDSRR